MTADLAMMPAHELVKLYKARKASPVEATRAALARIDAGECCPHGLDRRGLAVLVEFHQLVGRHHRKIGGHHLVSDRAGNFRGWESA